MPKILYLVHSLPPEEHTGTPLFAYGYAQSMSARGYEVTVAYPSFSSSSWTLIPERFPGESFDRVVVPSTSFTGPFWSIEAASKKRGSNPPATEAFLQLLRLIQPDLVHVVNNVNLPLDYPELAKFYGIPVVRSVTCAEDLCGLIAPVSPRSDGNGYCAAPITPDHCARCVAAVFTDALQDENSGHRELVAKLARKRGRAAQQYLRTYDRMIFATAAFRHYFEQTLPLDPARVRVIGMGMDLTLWRDPLPTDSTDLSAMLALEASASASPTDRVMFCLAATLDPAKGTGTVVEAFTHPQLLERDDYRLLLLGGGNKSLVAPLVDANPHVIMGGAYRPRDLPKLLKQMDVGLSTSGFETFHRVTREYLLAGLPVVGSRAFGIPDIIQHGRNGLLFDSADPTTLVRAIISLLDDRDLLATLTEGARLTPVRSLDEEADELADLYEEVLSETESGRVGTGALHE